MLTVLIPATLLLALGAYLGREDERRRRETWDDEIRHADAELLSTIDDALAAIVGELRQRTQEARSLIAIMASRRHKIVLSGAGAGHPASSRSCSPTARRRPRPGAHRSSSSQPCWRSGSTPFCPAPRGAGGCVPAR